MCTSEELRLLPKNSSRRAEGEFFSLNFKSGKSSTNFTKIRLLVVQFNQMKSNLQMVKLKKRRMFLFSLSGSSGHGGVCVFICKKQTYLSLRASCPRIVGGPSKKSEKVEM